MNRFIWLSCCLALLASPHYLSAQGSGPDLVVNTISVVVDGNTGNAQALINDPGADGVISLPEAIAAADNTLGSVHITFDLPLGSVIHLTTPLLLNASNTTIDGALHTSGQPGVTLEINSPSALIITGDNNLIQNIAMSGLEVQAPAFNNHITMSYFGLSAAGGPLSHNGTGIALLSANNTMIDHNVIAGNAALNETVTNNVSGILIAAGTTGTAVTGNLIGVNEAGVPIPNDIGITIIDASNNLIGLPAGGGSCQWPCNLISGNSTNAIQIVNADSVGNIVAGNFIGTSADGHVALPNGIAFGLRNAPAVAIIQGASGNTIGGTQPGECSAGCNLISGNASTGVMVQGVGTANNAILGNYIGVGADGFSALSNGGWGVSIEYGAVQTKVGDLRSGVPCNGGCNLISGNLADGIAIHEVGTSGTVVQGNYIGLNGQGIAALPNGGFGIWQFNGAQSSLIGGSRSTACDGACNVISGNARSGIGFQSLDPTQPTSFNVVTGNVIGLSANQSQPVANQESGINVLDGAADQTIGGNGAPTGSCQQTCNTISGNLLGGVLVQGPSTSRVTIIGNSIVNNGDSHLAIDLGNDGVTPNSALAPPPPPLNGPNGHVNFPVGVTSHYDGSETIVSGLIDATAPQSDRVDVYASRTAICLSPAAVFCIGAGEVYIGQATIAASGAFRLVYNRTLPLPIVSATVTDATGSTSEMSEACSDRVSNDGIVDQDGDGICDDWEIFGMDVNADGTLDLAINSGVNGASPLHKDLYVEFDYIPTATVTQDMLDFVLHYMAKQFSIAPVINADSTPGISVHFAADTMSNGSGNNGVSDYLDEQLSIPTPPPILIVAAAATDSTSGYTTFANLRNGDGGDPCVPGSSAHFGTVADRADSNCHNILLAKRLIFRYGILGTSFSTLSSNVDSAEPNTASGSENSTQDFFVAMDHTTNPAVSLGRNLYTLAGTITHELGHTLGLCHGGPLTSGQYACVQPLPLVVPPQWALNCKPNYVSVMNYQYQGPARWLLSADLLKHRARCSAGNCLERERWHRFTFIFQCRLHSQRSRGSCAVLHRVRGWVHLGSEFRGRNVGTSASPQGIDWNGENGVEVNPLMSNIHLMDPIATSNCNDVALRELDGAEDWSAIRYSFRDAPDFAADHGDYAALGALELSQDTASHVMAVTDTDADGVMDAMDNCPLTANPDQEKTGSGIVGDACAIAASTFSPISVKAGSGGSVTVTFTDPVPSTGRVIWLLSTLNSISMSSTRVSVPGGASSITVPITTQLIQSAQSGFITVFTSEDYGRIPISVTVGLSFGVTNLGTLGGTYSAAVDVNDAGTVVGNSFLSGQITNAQPFVWQSGTMNELPTNGALGGGNANAVNAAGVIAGDAGESATYWFGGTLHILNPPSAATNAYVSRINASGAMVGAYFSSAGNDYHAALWSAGGAAQDLGTLGGTYSVANAINTSGQIAGSSGLTDGSFSAFLYSGNTMTALPKLPGLTSCKGGAVNSAGVVYGICFTPTQPVHLVVWSGTSLTDLGELFGATSGDVTDVNDVGQVVGTVNTASSEIPFLWSQGLLFNLNDLLPAGSGWQLQNAAAINKTGQIVGAGTLILGDSQAARAYLLTPQ